MGKEIKLALGGAAPVDPYYGVIRAFFVIFNSTLGVFSLSAALSAIINHQ